MNKTKIFLAVLVALAIGSGFGAFIGAHAPSADSESFGAGFRDNNNDPVFTNGFRVGQNGARFLSKAGALTVGGGTAIDLVKCASATWNPGAVTATTTASATTTLTGASLGDMVIRSIALDQAGLELDAYVNAANTVTYRLSQPDADNATPVDIATTTIQVCAIST